MLGNQISMACPLKNESRQQVDDSAVDKANKKLSFSSDVLLCEETQLKYFHS